MTDLNIIGDGSLTAEQKDQRSMIDKFAVQPPTQEQVDGLEMRVDEVTHNFRQLDVKFDQIETMKKDIALIE